MVATEQCCGKYSGKGREVGTDVVEGCGNVGGLVSRLKQNN